MSLEDRPGFIRRNALSIVLSGVALSSGGIIAEDVHNTFFVKPSQKNTPGVTLSTGGTSIASENILRDNGFKSVVFAAFFISIAGFEVARVRRNYS